MSINPSLASGLRSLRFFFYYWWYSNGKGRRLFKLLSLLLIGMFQ